MPFGPPRAGPVRTGNHRAEGFSAVHLNSYGDASKGSTLSNAFSGFASTTPEAALWQGLHATPSNQARKMYPADPRYAILKALFGTVTPRMENRMIGNANASEERKAAGR